MNHIIVRVYNNDSMVWNCVKEEDKESHIEYNKEFRFGCALFLDGKCVYNGYLNDERVKSWEERLKSMSFNKYNITYPYR